MTKVALIGLGALGKRHLEAVLKSEQSMEIYCMDINPKAMEGFEPKDVYYNKKIIFVTDVKEFPTELELAIFPMSSKGRREMFDCLVEHSTVKYIVFEKVLFQKVEDYFHVASRLKELNICAWVNCTRRYAPIWKDLQKELENAENIELHNYGGSWGLACNCVHILDVVCMISNSNHLKIENFQLQDKVIDSKRQGYKEVFGTISGNCGNCHNFTISCYENCLPTETIILADDNKYIVNESKGSYEVVRKNGTSEVKEFGPYYVSQTTTVIVNDILKKGTCDLTTFELAMDLHLEYIKPLIVFFEEKGMEEGVCPIT